MLNFNCPYEKEAERVLILSEQKVMGPWNRERVEDSILLVLKMEEGNMSQGIHRM